jgi:pimeloyl-ACP methyl ester carboxylesterase
MKGQVFGNANNAKAIVCLHGRMDNSNSFKPMAPYLCQSNEYYLVVLDLPGHGLSSKLPHGIPYTPKLLLTAVRAAVRHLNLRDFYFLCHSYGNTIGFLVILFTNKNKN